MDAVHVGGLGGTYGGNPIACAAALATIETMRELDLAGAARRIGDGDGRPRLPVARRAGPADRRGARPRRDARRRARPRPARSTPDPATTAAVSAACHAAGLLTLTCGTYGNVLRFLPPLVIDEPTLGRGLDILDDAFAAS